MQWENLKSQVPISSKNQYSVTTSPTWRGTDGLHKCQVKYEVRNLKVKYLQYIDRYPIYAYYAVRNSIKGYARKIVVLLGYIGVKL